MKYFLVPSLLGLSLTAFADTLPVVQHNGYIGLGVTEGKFNSRSAVMTTNKGFPSFPQNNNNVKINGHWVPNLKVLGGYRAKSDCLFVQAEGFFQPSLKNETNKKSFYTGNRTRNNLEVKLKRNWTAGFSVKPGTYITDVFGVFGSIGVVYSQFKTTVTTDPSQQVSPSSSYSKKKWGMTVGGGLTWDMQSVWAKPLLISLEYGYETYGKFKTPSLQSFKSQVSDVQNVITHKVKGHTTTLSLSYLF